MCQENSRSCHSRQLTPYKYYDNQINISIYKGIQGEQWRNQKLNRARGVTTEGNYLKTHESTGNWLESENSARRLEII